MFMYAYISIYVHIMSSFILQSPTHPISTKCSSFINQMRNGHPRRLDHGRRSVNQALEHCKEKRCLFIEIHPSLSFQLEIVGESDACHPTVTRGWGGRCLRIRISGI